MTDAQFEAYVEQEVEAAAMEVYTEAVGTAHSIGHVFGSKGDVLGSFRAQLLGKSNTAAARSNDVAEMTQLRKRIHAIVGGIPKPKQTTRMRGSAKQ